MLKDGTAMEEWEYYRQNHTARDAEAAVIGMPNPASKFCVDKGGKSVTEKDKNGNERGVCRFNTLIFIILLSLASFFQCRFYPSCK